jgi:ankyrin repeat protein
MKRIQDQNEEDRTVAHSALTWVANAKRPLTVPEIQVALAIEPGARHLDTDNILDIEIILSVCAGLVIVDEQLAVVRLVHYTTQEYFDSIQSQHFPYAQTVITQSLLTYLTFDYIANSSWTTDPPPLLDYAQYCLVHATGEPEAQLRTMIIEFLGRIKDVRGPRWISPPWDILYWPEHCSALWVAATTNLVETAKFLLQRVPTPPYSERTAALQIASFEGHLPMVQLLVENGADINAPAGRYIIPVRAASLGDDIGEKEEGVDYGTALQAACIGCNPTIVRLLLESGADVDAQWGDYGNAIQTASILGHEPIVRLLLEHGADVNVRGGEYGGALQAASYAGHENIVRLLLEHGADANIPAGEYSSGLQAAASEGHENIVRLLLESGADVDTQGGEHFSALQAASLRGHGTIVQLLFDHGADLNLQGGDLGNALQAAASQGHENIVRFMVGNGADVDARGGLYGSAPNAALIEGHENIAQFLMDEGRTKRFNMDAYCPLESALSQHDDQNIALLIDMYSALDAALSNGDGSCSQLLIEQIVNGTIYDQIPE